MKIEKILIDVSYTHKTGDYYQDSYVKNKIVYIDGDLNDTIANVLKDDDGMILSYKNKPQSSVYIDDKDGKAKVVGYIYKGKSEIQNEKTGKWIKVTFDVWVTISKILDYPLKEIF